MKFATSKEHRDFFQKQGWIEFEGLLSADQLTLTNQAIDQVLAERLNVSSEKMNILSADKIYMQGHDLWRGHSFLQKLVTQLKFAEIAAGLVEKKILRLGSDQLYFTPYQDAYAPVTTSTYAQFLEKISPLEAVSCFNEVVCGLILSLGGKEQPIVEKIPTSEEVVDVVSEEVKEEVSGIDIFPSQAGHVLFFQPNVPIRWDNLYKHPGQRYYLIVYTNSLTYYLLQPEDPHTHSLKRLGYIFNDKLSDKLNPIVFRT